MMNEIKEFILEPPVFFYTSDEGQIVPINEYTLRNIMLGIAQGRLSPELNIIDQTGQRVEFAVDGGIDNNPYRMGLNAKLSFDLVRLRRA